MKIFKRARENRNMLKELNYADVFNSTIHTSEWLMDKTFSPTSYAIGYPLLYVLYRILDEQHPENILEFGLGQSTKLFHQYSAFMRDAHVTTLEHDAKWIEFFLSKKPLPKNAGLVVVESEIIKYKGFKTRSIKDLEEHVKDKRFDLILVDAPTVFKRYSRSQILKMVPGNINPDHFIIIIDDSQRRGERDTCRELENSFRNNNIDFFKGEYCGIKTSSLYCSSDLKFLTTL
jgi:predicted O-methyltransferase YrrM